MTHDLLIFPGNLGWMGLAIQVDTDGGSRIRRLSFGHPTETEARAALRTAMEAEWSTPTADPPIQSVGGGPLTAEWEDWMAALQAFTSGQAVDLRHLPIDLDYLSDFGRRVILACRELVWGQTTTYGELARQVGSPGASRAVGAVMARNRHPLIVPCHRVLASNGGLQGFSAAGGLRTKEELLRNEAAGGSFRRRLAALECQ